MIQKCQVVLRVGSLTEAALKLIQSAITRLSTSYRPTVERSHTTLIRVRKPCHLSRKSSILAKSCCSCSAAESAGGEQIQPLTGRASSCRSRVHGSSGRMQAWPSTQLQLRALGGQQLSRQDGHKMGACDSVPQLRYILTIDQGAHRPALAINPS